MGRKKTSKKEDSEQKKTSEKSSVHIKLENEEAVLSKRDILSSEMNLLKIERNIQNYQKLRGDEMKVKRLIQKKAREIRMNINKLQVMIPSPKIPRILKKEISISEPEKIEENVHFNSPKRRSTVESQLLEIQDRLNELQGRGIEE
jgi:hypothetical protein